ncbi:hypothetical protein BG006_009799, partial [Podila minutissima]
GSVSANKPMKEGNKNTLWLYFMTKAPVTDASKPLAPALTLADYLMEQLYKDTASQDVVFAVGKEAVGMETEAVMPSGETSIQEALADVIDLHPKGSKSNEQDLEEVDVKNKKESDDKEETGDSHHSEVKEHSKDKEGSDDQKTSNNVLNPDGAKSIDSDSQNKPKDIEEKGKEAKQKGSVSEMTVSAHKMVLLHWPFFRKMIKAADSDSNVIQLHIRDMKQEVFHVLIWFLYTGRLPLGMEPKILFADGTTKEEETSWEDLFLAADYCKIDELHQVALTTILSKLTPKGTIPFLFHTAYSHKDLWEQVVKYVATTCGAEISKKSVQKEYTNHAKCIEIFGKIIMGLHTFVASVKSSKK